MGGVFIVKKPLIQFSFIFCFSFCFVLAEAQVNSLELNAEKEKLFQRYMLARHSGSDGLAEFKRDQPHEYLKELWYYSSSFYIKRDYQKEGVEMNVGAIDISRYEYARKQTEEIVLLLTGYKDALVLLPIDQLIYKP